MSETNGPKTLKGETFKAIPGFPGYRISNLGRVFSENRGKVMAGFAKKLVVLQKNKKPHCRSVGKLVYETFKGKVKKGSKVQTTKPGNYALANLTVAA